MASMLENSSRAQCFFLEVKAQTPQYIDALHWLCILLHGCSCLPAAFGNGIITLTLWKTPSLQRPSFILLSWTAFADALTGLLAQPVAIASFVSKLQRRLSVACVLDVAKESLAWLFSGVSVSILALLSVERYLVLYLGFDYRTVVTTTRLMLIVVTFWASLIVLAMLRFSVIRNETYVAIHLPFMFLGLVLLTATYCRIHQCITRRKTQTCPENQDPDSFDIVKYKKITSAVFYIVCFYWLFFAPFVFVLVVYLLAGFTDAVEGAYNVTATLVLTNAAVNPVLYCWRLRVLRKAVFKETKRLLHLNSV